MGVFLEALALAVSGAIRPGIIPSPGVTSEEVPMSQHVQWWPPEPWAPPQGWLWCLPPSARAPLVPTGPYKLRKGGRR